MNIKKAEDLMVIRRNGQEVKYDRTKIKRAITKANNESSGDPEALTENQIDEIVDDIESYLCTLSYNPTVENIQDKVIYEIMKKGAFKVAKDYTEYRYKHNMNREASRLDQMILSIVDYDNELIKQENSNKNPQVAPVQRDYVAGEVSKDISERLLIPKDIIQAHEKGLIHFHDLDYFLQKIYNCCLINMGDVLEYGTVISETMIEKPKSFSTACNVATQVIAQVASSQYGGQSFSLASLVPFIEVSRQKIRRRKAEHFKQLGKEVDEALINELAELSLREEIQSGVQLIQYQILTLMTTNGQTPFVSMFIWINEVEESQRDDFAILIEEVLKQRILGVKNEKGVYVTPAFPKILYVLDENNTYEGSKYYYLTRLAAECTAKRMVPDYISAKKMREYKKGDVYPCMGCVDGNSIIDYKIHGTRFVESFERAWDRLSKFYYVKTQKNKKDLYMDTPGVSIYDNKEKKYVKQLRMIRNTQTDWYRIKFTGGRYIDVTNNHPFEVEGRGVVLADELSFGDIILRQNVEEVTSNSKDFDVKFDNVMWALGLIICDGCYDGQVSATLGMDEMDIARKLMSIFESEFSLLSYYKERHRGKKGDYIETRVNNSTAFGKRLTELFEGLRKSERHIPNIVFNATREEKLSFLAGMIDADGYVNNSGSSLHVQLGSTNEELALQQMALVMDLGLNAAIYENRYTKKDRTKIRYRVEFDSSLELISYLVSQKKVSHFEEDHTFYDNTVVSSGECMVKEIQPYVDYKYSYDVTTESEHFTVNGIYSHNCRSFLTPDRFSEEKGNISKAKNFVEGKHKYYGRFNQGVVTLNLVDVACSSGRDFDKFWEILDERLELCHRALRCRHERLLGTTADTAPILFRHGAIARLDKGETIDKLLYDGYSTISLGYAGAYEMCMYMTGKSHTSEEGEKFTLSVMQRLNDKCNEWKAEENIDYSVYGTPLESTTYKFAKCLKERFGVIKDVTDHNYITNSYHCVVREQISAFDKLKFESKFQVLSPGGAISYVEVPDMNANIDAVVEIIQFIYENIMYAEINSKSDYCMECGYDGEIQIIPDKAGKLIWKCPNCGNTNQDKMSVARRTCGYIGTQFWNQGRTEEIRDRVLHVAIEENKNL